jgi:hypothetical protein
MPCCRPFGYGRIIADGGMSLSAMVSREVFAAHDQAASLPNKEFQRD